MARDRIWIGGLDVGTRAIHARDLSGVLAVPEKRGENLDVDGRNGAIHVPGKKYRGRRCEFEFLVFGRNPDGTVPADPQTCLRDNLRALARVLSQELFPLVHQLADGTFREIPVEVAVALTPDYAKTRDMAVLGVSFDSASAFWRGQAAVPASFSLTTTSTRELTEYGTSEAPIDDPLVTIGASSNPALTDLGSGTFLAYDAVIPSGQALQVDCATGRLVGIGGLVPDHRKLRLHPRDGRWLALTPTLTGPPVVRLTQTGGSAAVPITLAAKPSWLFG